ncbi:MAG TPA: hypothetical protein P5320_03725 [Bacteroidales bacterium]|nr:hypothetical protein [Bacteroidales bacterium]HOK75097.1 hypothetical protein [Bacteroidales bacterium]HOM40237.1 hypothetical protein [Bacteroidales bacterium]HPP92944.1 hypothetical protein [Bacteroidales bacterium]HRR15810.1 hypothetical protein [Bacteroidales bacterium]
MKPFFKKFGWIYLPVSLAGWIITVIFAGISLATLVWIDSAYNSLFYTLVRFFPYFIGFTVVWFWIASNSAGSSGNK